MVRAWYMDNDPSDQRNPHMKDPSSFLELSELKKLTGVEYFKFDVDTLDQCEQYSKLRKDRGYTYEDNISISKDTLPNYDEKLKMFFTEHLHSDEEIRLCEDGSGYFDVRDGDDQWIRVELEKGDLIVLPAGIYHRFTLDNSNYIKARRLFVGEPVWTPINRPAEDHVARKEYLKRQGASAL